MRLETAAEVVKSRFTSSTPLEQQVLELKITMESQLRKFSGV
jgi:hypothetical protein